MNAATTAAATAPYIHKQAQEARHRQRVGIVVVGHVDHGKSTLIGRLLHDTGTLSEAKVKELMAASERRGGPVEWSFALDALQAERDQAVTIDTTQIWFSSTRRDYVLIDAPGHHEFLKNMISGATQADAAVLVVDAEEGLKAQTRRHAYLLHLLGVPQVVVAVNKMDRVGFGAARFNEVRNELSAYLGSIGVQPLEIVPISAREGANLASPSADLAWYGAGTLLDALDRTAPMAPPSERALRVPIQDVLRQGDERILMARIESGVLRQGDEIVFSPTDRAAVVETFREWNGPGYVEARAGQSVAFTLDRPIFVERGDVASHDTRAPTLQNVFRARVFWLDRTPLAVGNVYTLKLGTQKAPVTVQAIERVIDTDTLAHRDAETVERNQIAEIVLRSANLLALDAHHENPALGRFALVDGVETVAGGLVGLDGFPDQRTQRRKATNISTVSHKVSVEERALRSGHKGGVFWLTGLSGSGKSTLSMEVERRLIDKGIRAYVLDGDNVRDGLCSDLGFSPEDRTENIRRVAHVANLMADSGTVVVTAFISPYRNDRDAARAVSGAAFHEIHVDANLETCEARDPKGLYKKARAGKIPEFTGISAPYEPPVEPELRIDTAALALDDCVDRLAQYIVERTRLNEA